MAIILAAADSPAGHAARDFAVQEARRHLDDLEAVWRSRLDRFGEVLADRPEEQDR